jgi:hypothetical protein
MNRLSEEERLSHDAKYRNHHRLRRWFVFTSAGVLFLTALAKLWVAFGSSKILKLDDPIMGVSFRYLVLTAAILELAVAVACIFGKLSKLAVGLIAWLSTCFLIYRVGVWWMGWHRPCGCLGTLSDALHIRPELADNIMKVVLVYLLVGSYAFCFFQRRLSN